MPENIVKVFTKKINSYVDRTVIHPKRRWTGLAVLFVTYLLRVLLARGYAVITYMGFVHILTKFIDFISPLKDPEEESLPQQNNEESQEKPTFERKLPEFKFWLSTVKTLLVCFFLTFFSFLDIQVYTPLLIVYFLFLTVFSLKQQVDRMIKHRYNPFDFSSKGKWQQMSFLGKMISDFLKRFKKDKTPTEAEAAPKPRD
eukprot:TRINITY_DN1035_c0_g1_i2.p1 TRINITY_DN1035_c0_g1~~TRINITY_DN1035_c0_g1_i2.p1  ORF type:complete len:200 (+),score=32.94 TRINITY_DN1035_c0_g1_i2:66-665(+)